MSTFISKGKKKFTKIYKQKINRWKAPFIKVEIPSSADGAVQRAYYYNPNTKHKAPLIVSLHSWAGTFEQIDTELSQQAIKSNWNYIHPDFRGKNNTPQACGSDLSMSDINDAILFAIENGNVDLENIFIVGSSGGAYAGLCFYSSSKYKINSFLVWSPITDLIAWHDQSIIRNLRYSQDIMNGTSSIDLLNIEEAKKRSPLYRSMSDNGSNLYIFSGYHDGYPIKVENPVPLTHSINFFNEFALRNNANSTQLVQSEDIIRLAVREYQLTNDSIGGRKVIYSKVFNNAQLTIFDGGHEQLVNHSVKLINEKLK